jgi:hypothetical protein
MRHRNLPNRTNLRSGVVARGRYVVSVDLRPQKPFIFVETVTIGAGRVVFLPITLRYLTDEQLTVLGGEASGSLAGGNLAEAITTISRDAISEY